MTRSYFWMMSGMMRMMRTMGMRMSENSNDR